eukprot:jgi/Tetstr1/454042/TSEL_040961.t1
MEAFIEHSNACLNRVVDHIGGIQSKSDVRKYTDVYQHLLKVQRAAIEEGRPDSEAVDRFRREWAVCEPTLGGAGLDEAGEGEAGEQPTAEQLEEFKKTVAAWFQLDDSEKDLKRRASEKRMLKGRLTTGILAFMRRFDIEDLKTRDGNLRFFRREVAKTPPRAVQMQRIVDFFGEDRADMLETFKTRVFEAQRVERCGLRRLRAQ